MNILTLNYEFPPLGGGGATATLELAVELVRLGHSVDVVTMSRRGLAREEEVEGVRVFRVPSFRRELARCTLPEMASYLAGAAPFLLRRTRQVNYDIVHCHFGVPTGPLGTLLRWRRELPYVLTFRGSDVPGHNKDKFRLIHRFTKPLLRLAIKRAAAVTTLSQFMKERIEERICRCDVRVIPNGVHMSKWPAGTKKKMILMAGRLLPMKGFQNVLLALEGLGTDFEVHIAGDGPARTEMERIAGRLRQRVVFHGWLPGDGPELRSLFAEAAIFCMPSAAESFGLVFVQAMSAGCAVLGSTAGAIPEVVQDGVTGLLVPPGDVPAIREALTRLLQDDELRSSLAEAGKRRALEVYSWQTVGEQFLELYGRVLKSDHP